jgi:hypothetical protein
MTASDPLQPSGAHVGCTNQLEANAGHANVLRGIVCKPFCMRGWLYKLHHDRRFFARVKKRVLWTLAFYWLALGLWTGALPATLKDPFGVWLFRGHEGLGAWFWGGWFPAFWVYAVVVMMERINEAGGPEPPDP